MHGVLYRIFTTHTNTHTHFHLTSHTRDTAHDLGITVSGIRKPVLALHSYTYTYTGQSCYSYFVKNALH